MSKITNDGLTRHRTLYSCTHMATVGVKGLKWRWIATLPDAYPNRSRPRSLSHCVAVHTKLHTLQGRRHLDATD